MSDTYAEVHLMVRPDEPITQEELDEFVDMMGDHWDPEGEVVMHKFETPYHADQSELQEFEDGTKNSD